MRAWARACMLPKVCEVHIARGRARLEGVTEGLPLRKRAWGLGYRLGVVPRVACHFALLGEALYDITNQTTHYSHYK